MEFPSSIPFASVLNTAKSTGAEIMRSVGIRTPRARPILPTSGTFVVTLGGLEFPLLIREDRAHAGRLPIYLINSIHELEQVPIHEFAHPIAVEFIDVRDPRDGLFATLSVFRGRRAWHGNECPLFGQLGSARQKRDSQFSDGSKKSSSSSVSPIRTTSVYKKPAERWGWTLLRLTTAMGRTES